MDTTNIEDDMDSAELEVVMVRWIDASARADWHTPEANVTPCVSVGFLVAESDLAIEIASTIAEEDGICNASIIIPRGMIVDNTQKVH